MINKHQIKRMSWQEMYKAAFSVLTEAEIGRQDFLKLKKYYSDKLSSAPFSEHKFSNSYFNYELEAMFAKMGIDDWKTFPNKSTKEILDEGVECIVGSLRKIDDYIQTQNALAKYRLNEEMNHCETPQDIISEMHDYSTKAKISIDEQFEKAEQVFEKWMTLMTIKVFGHIEKKYRLKMDLFKLQALALDVDTDFTNLYINYKAAIGIGQHKIISGRVCSHLELIKK